jgi:hypothetical protein
MRIHPPFLEGALRKPIEIFRLHGTYNLIRYRLFIAALTFILALCFTSVIFAQTPAPLQQSSSIVMQAQPAFEGHFKYGEWLPVWIYLENNGSDVNAEVRIQVPGTSGGMTFVAPVELPTISRKRIALYILPNNFSRQLDVLLISQDQLLASQSISVKPHPPINYLAGLIAPERGALSSINSMIIPGQERPKVLVDLSISDIPDRFEGLRSFDLLIINDIDTSALTSQQVKALEAWVNQGGRLVIGGGVGAQNTLSGLSDSILPFSLKNTIELEKVSGLEDYISEENPLTYHVRVPGPFLAATGEATSASTLITQEGIPLLLEWNRGSGYVDFVALDLSASPFDAWNGTTPFWENLTKLGSAYPSWMPPDISSRQQIASQMPYALSNLPMLDLPSTKNLAVLLGLYIIFVGPANYLVLRKQKRLHLAWITIPAITIVFSVAAFGLGYALHGTDIFLNKIAVINLQPDGKAYANSYMGLFSPSRSDYEIQIQDDGLISPLGSYYEPWSSVAPSPGNSSRGMIFYQGNPARVSGLNVEQWSMQSFMTEGLEMDFGQVTSDLDLEGNTLAGNIINKSPYLLSDAVIVLGRSFTRLNNIAPGEEAQVNLNLDDLSNPSFGTSISYRLFEQQLSMSGPNGLSRQAEVKRIIVESVFERTPASSKWVGGNALNGAANIFQGPILIAWLDEAPPDIQIAGQSPAQQTTAILLAPLTYSLPKTGRIDLPVGTIPGSLSVIPRDGSTCGDPSATAVYIYRGEAKFEFNLSISPKEVQVENLKLAVWSDSGFISPPSIAIFNWSEQNWIPLDGVAMGVNLIPDAARFVNSTGQIQIRLSTSEDFQGGCYYLDMGMEGYHS